MRYDEAEDIYESTFKKFENNIITKNEMIEILKEKIPCFKSNFPTDFDKMIECDIMKKKSVKFERGQKLLT